MELERSYKKVAFTMYPVENIARARNFYEKIIGLEYGKISGEGRWIEYDLPNGGCFCITDLVEEIKPSANAGGQSHLKSITWNR